MAKKSTRRRYATAKALLEHTTIIEGRLRALEAAQTRLLIQRRQSLEGLTNIINAKLLTENQALSELVAQMRTILIEHGLAG